MPGKNIEKKNNYNEICERNQPIHIEKCNAYGPHLSSEDENIYLLMWIDTQVLMTHNNALHINICIFFLLLTGVLTL